MTIGREIRLFEHGFVRLDGAMATDLSVVNSARVSFAKRKEVMEESDAGLIRFLMRERHGCYDDATEVLTFEGWKPWPHVTGSELFATRSPAGTLEYQPALRLVRTEYRGHMIGFEGMSVDLLVTPDHRVLTERMTTCPGWSNREFSLRPAHTVLWRAHRHTATARWRGSSPTSFRLDGREVPTSPVMMLLGLFIGDGYLPASNHIVFDLRKDREIRFLRQLAADLALDLKDWGKARTQFALSLGPEMRQLFVACYDGREKAIPRHLLELSPEPLEALLEGLMESGGTRHIRGEGREDRLVYSTTSRRLADAVQELALKIGRTASVRPHGFDQDEGHYGHKVRWRVTIDAERNCRPALCLTREQADNHMGVEEYDGVIHCVEVANGTLYVRRNGYPVFCGNTPFEHNAFRFHIRCPLFVAREWFRHRIGCLTGDTVVTFVNTNGQATKQLSKTIDDLWRMWTQGERNGQRLSPAKAGTTAYRHARLRVRKMKLRVLNEKAREFEIGHIADIIDKGIQPVYRITLADGKRLTATENHRVLTQEGWKTLREAAGLNGEGAAVRMTRECTLFANGVAVYQDYKWLKTHRDRGLSIAPFASHLAFAKESIDLQERRGFKLTARPVRVVAIEYVGLRQTYDLCVEGPWHNFVANGIVVHNSFNEESARYHQLEGDFYVPEAEDVRSQVGKPGAYTFEPVEPEVAETVRRDLAALYAEAYRLYQDLIDRGLAKELARCVLPMGTFTQFYWTVNARSLMNFLSLRAADTAQLEIRRYAEAVETFFAEVMPVTYEAFVANARVAP